VDGFEAADECRHLLMISWRTQCTSVYKAQATTATADNPASTHVSPLNTKASSASTKTLPCCCNPTRQPYLAPCTLRTSAQLCQQLN
jgi:hypothetical protein